MPGVRSFSRYVWRDDRSLPAPAYADGVRDIAPRPWDCHFAGRRESPAPEGVPGAGRNRVRRMVCARFRGTAYFRRLPRN